MDENLAWKIVYAAAIFSLLVLGLAYYLIYPRESVFFEPGKEEKIAEFKKTRVGGRKEGKKSWEFFAESGCPLESCGVISKNAPDRSLTKDLIWSFSAPNPFTGEEIVRAKTPSTGCPKNDLCSKGNKICGKFYFTFLSGSKIV